MNVYLMVLQLSEFIIPEYIWLSTSEGPEGAAVEFPKLVHWKKVFCILLLRVPAEFEYSKTMHYNENNAFQEFTLF